MHKVKLSTTGAYFWVLSDGEESPDSAPGFTAEEYAWARKIAAGLTQDPAELRHFWHGCVEQKIIDPHYDIFKVFPMMNEEKGNNFLQTPEGKISQEILATLRGRAKEEPDE